MSLVPEEMKRILNESRPPPGAWVKYVDPDTGEKMGHPYYLQVKELARKHRRQRGLPIPVDWDQKFIDVICQHNPVMCAEVPTFLEKATTLAVALGKWALSGFKVVTEEQLQARMNTCPSCEWFKGWRRPHQASCGKCGCSRVKLYLATEKCPLNKWPV